MISFFAWLFKAFLWCSRHKRSFVEEEAFEKRLFKERQHTPVPPPFMGERDGISISKYDTRLLHCYEIESVEAGDLTILYLHGGCYTFPAEKGTHIPFVMDLAKRLKARVVLPLYPLAPEHKFRETLGVLLELYSLLCEEVQAMEAHSEGESKSSTRGHSRGRGPAGASSSSSSSSSRAAPRQHKLVAMGDSAGGGMALLLAQLIASSQALPSPGKRLRPLDSLVLISPWLDLEIGDEEAWSVDSRDPSLAMPGLRWAAAHYAGVGNESLACCSPLFGSLQGLPPTSIFVGTADILMPACRRMKERWLGEPYPHNNNFASRLSDSRVLSLHYWRTGKGPGADDGSSAATGREGLIRTVTSEGVVVQARWSGKGLDRTRRGRSRSAGRAGVAEEEGAGRGTDSLRSRGRSSGWSEGAGNAGSSSSSSSSSGGRPAGGDTLLSHLSTSGGGGASSAALEETAFSLLAAAETGYSMADVKAAAVVEVGQGHILANYKRAGAGGREGGAGADSGEADLAEDAGGIGARVHAAHAAHAAGAATAGRGGSARRALRAAPFRPPLSAEQERLLRMKMQQKLEFYLRLHARDAAAAAGGLGPSSTAGFSDAGMSRGDGASSSPLRYFEYPSMQHIWPLIGWLPEAQRARQQMIRCVQLDTASDEAAGSIPGKREGEEEEEEKDAARLSGGGRGSRDSSPSRPKSRRAAGDSTRQAGGHHASAWGGASSISSARGGGGGGGGAGGGGGQGGWGGSSTAPEEGVLGSWG